MAPLKTWQGERLSSDMLHTPRAFLLHVILCSLVLDPLSDVISSTRRFSWLCRVEDELVGIAALEEAVLKWRRDASKGQKEQPEWFHPLRSLVQAGIPMVCHSSASAASARCPCVPS